LFVNGHTLNAGVSGVNYSWYKGDVRVGVPNQIAGANSQTYTPTNFRTSFSLTTFSTSGPQCDDTSIVILIDTNCLAYFRPTQITPGQEFIEAESFCHLSFVLTLSSISTNICSCLSDVTSCEIPQSVNDSRKNSIIDILNIIFMCLI
jgi:hypothetical protein